MRRPWAIGLGTLACVLAVAAVAAGHSAPDPLANEVHVLEDDARDEFCYYDGYDVHHLHVREAYDPIADQKGLIFRFPVFGGFGPADRASELQIGLEASGPDGKAMVQLSTTDGKNWSIQEGRVLVEDVNEVSGPEWPCSSGPLQVFAPYETYGVAPGDTLEGITMYSRADGELRDKAPGGIYLPNSGGQVEIPCDSENELPCQSQRHVDALDLTGPSGYLNVNVTTDGSNATIQADNALDNGQHVTAEILDTPGWNASIVGPEQASIDADGSIAFPIQAEASPDATEPLEVLVTSDLGAYRTVYLGALDGELTASSAPDELSVDAEEPAQESPGPGAVGALVAVTALAAAVGRQDG